MIYHCGLLADNPLESRSYNWVMRRGWFQEGFPPDVLHELAVWLAMPGFDTKFHAANLRTDWGTIRRAQLRLCSDFELLRNDVAANWSSASRDDCIRLCRMRKVVGKSAGVPLICQMRILDDLKAGLSHKAAARVWDVTPRWVNNLSANRGPLGASYWRLPSGFELLLAKS